MDGFVAAYDRTTGRKLSVPPHWLEHKVLGRNLRKTPLAEKAQREADKKSADSTNTTNPPATGDTKKG